MVYTAASPSLAVLEVLVHLDLPAELLPEDYQLLTIAIPDDAPVHVFDAEALDNTLCQDAGDAFLKAGEALAMKVRSFVVPQEWNVLLNARHPLMPQVTIARSEPFRLDPRLFP